MNGKANNLSHTGAGNTHTGARKIKRTNYTVYYQSKGKKHFSKKGSYLDYKTAENNLLKQFQEHQITDGYILRVEKIKTLKSLISKGGGKK